MHRQIIAALSLAALLIALPPALLAQEKHPAEVKGLKSLESKIPTVLLLINGSKQTLKLYWLDYTGKRVDRGTLKPGQRFDSETFVTHPWLVTDEKGNAWAVYLPDAQPRAVEVSVPACRKPTPAGEYQKREIHGFTVLIHPDLLRRHKDAAEAMTEMTRQLKAISEAVPAGPLAKLRKVDIWLEWDTFGASAAQFHLLSSRRWLEVRGLNPDKAGCVDINHARHFIDWSRQDQPWMVMHELAHAYHNLVLGAKHAGIKAAYDQAIERKLYDLVARADGSKQEAYARTNDQEYFAELTEAYFGRNDFFPFDRKDLEKHDPVGYQLMRDVWEQWR